jgi:ATP-dependent protease Clp ATPase subunit
MLIYNNIENFIFLINNVKKKKIIQILKNYKNKFLKNYGKLFF